MSHIRLDRDGAVSIVTLARAERRNAVTGAMMADLESLARGFADDEATRAVIVRAEGSDFSVGADLAASPSARTGASLLTRRRAAEGGMRLMRALQEIPQPTIAAVQGVATGAGACIASACDFRIAGTSARIGYGEVKLGMNLMWNAAPLCLRLVGLSRAKRMIMSGELFDAATLERWGFVDEVVNPAELDAAATTMAERYAALPPVSVAMIKRSLDHLAGALDRAVMHMDADQWLLATSSEDYREAVSAFFEKRPASFKGR